MTAEDIVLEGRHVRLEPLAQRHVEALALAADADRSPYEWSFVPQGVAAMSAYVAAALAERAAGSALPFATVRNADAAVIGSTRFFRIARWAWPAGHPQAARSGPDVCEIGYTWLAASALRTAANTEAKLLMLTQAFEAWQLHRVCFHTDMRNERSRNALLRLGARFEGTLRAHRLASDLTPRDSARYSLIASEWPWVKQRLTKRLAA